MTYDPEDYWPDRYREQGPAYVARAGSASVSAAQLEAVTPYLRHLPDEGRVLDFGCGPGRFRSALEGMGLEYEGVDLIPELGTMDMADVEPESFDGALAIFVLQHIVDSGRYADAVNLLRGALKPDGTLLVVDSFHLDSPNEHMKPRGAASVLTAGFRSYEPLGTFQNHWIGVFSK